MNTDLERLRAIKSFPSLVKYLRDELDWEFETDDVEDLTYEYNAAEFGLDTKSAAAIREIKQLRPLVGKQPWGIFYLDFAGQKISVSALRGILRGLVAKKRGSANPSEMQKWQVENLLFICTSDDFSNFNFGYFRGSQTNRAILSTFGWHHGDTHLRTLAEYNLPALRFPSDTSNAENWLNKWRAAFDVEAVTDKFFDDYHKVFVAIENEVRATIKSDEQARLYTQRLFNRLMFIYFIQKKGWLSFNGEQKYLRALFNAAEEQKEKFLHDRLHWLFFYGMGNAGLIKELKQLDFLEQKRGVVPYLNGGLFDVEDDHDAKLSKDQLLQAADVEISNDAFRKILDLFERYNFTVEESTPLNVQVAVDPEMLGKVFEELVTGRHETGSYYTPRPIVSFMCREALKHYLDAVQPSKEAVAKFVDEEDASELQNPEAVLEALKRVRICDPACGSGAYLLGMMHELTRLRAALFKSKKIDDATLYDRKRWIIENNLYGVDNDKFAVQIACLRLWLSLAIESEEPHPLPNLDFKIECGDSLTAPAPSEAEKQMTFARTALVTDFRQAKGEYMREVDPDRKRQLRQRIVDLRAEIALALKHKSPRATEGQIQKKEQELVLLRKNIESARNATIKAELEKQVEKYKRTLSEWRNAAKQDDNEFDWAVEFAEVFMPLARDRWRMDDLHPMLNDFKRQGTLVEEAQPDTDSGGFDIVLANPPYVRHRALGREYKEKSLKTNYSDVFSSLADLYVYFFARAQQLLRDGGVGCFISSNKWLQQEYGENLRQELLDKQAFHLVVDFGELPVFASVTAYTAVFLWQKLKRESVATSYAVVEDLEKCYAEGLRECVDRIAQAVPASQFGSGKSRLSTSNKRVLMDASGQPLGELASAIFVGLQTSADKIYILDFVKEVSKNRVLLHSKATGEDHIFERDLVKPILSGADVKRYEQPEPSQFIIFPYNVKDGKATLIPEKELGKRVPLTSEYLKQNRAPLEARENGKLKGPSWYAFGRNQNLDKQEFVKLCVPRLVSRIQTIFDNDGSFYLDNVDVGGVTLTNDDETNYLFVMAVLNSQLLTWYLRQISTPFRGGFYSCNKQYLSRLPIPEAPISECKAVAKIARHTQQLHTGRRKSVEKFLRTIGIEPAESSSRNPLEQPWTLSAEDFMRRARHAPMKMFTDARDETYSLTEEITKVEYEIDERVAALYGVTLEPTRTTATLSVGSDPGPFA